MPSWLVTRAESALPVASYEQSKACSPDGIEAGRDTCRPVTKSRLRPNTGDKRSDSSVVGTADLVDEQ